MRSATEISNTLERLEQRPAVFIDGRSMQIMFDLWKNSDNSLVRDVAARVWQSMKRYSLMWDEEGRAPESNIPLPDNVSLEEWNALHIEIENEQIRYGERTPKVEAFLESREQFQRSLRRSTEKYQTENIIATQEILSSPEKEMSPTFKTLEPVVQALAVEMGFTRPIQLEITREPSLNAFVLQVAKEGDLASSDVPLRVFVNAGLIIQLKKLLGKTPTVDHLSVILGHELRHLQQEGYNMDEPPKDKETSQRYEYDADAAGFEATDRIGRNPHAGLEVFQALRKASSHPLLDNYITRTHPMSENRIKELTMLFHRPDRPFFSAEVEMEPLSEDVIEECSRLVRQPLHEQMERCRNVYDWEELLVQLEGDERITLVDLKMVGQKLKVILDSMAGIAAADHDIATEGLMSRAILLRANALYQKHEAEIDTSSGETLDRGMIRSPKKPWKMTRSDLQIELPEGEKLPTPSLDSFLRSDEENLIALQGVYKDEMWRPGSREAFFTFYAAYGSDLKPINNNPTFTNISDLLDPTNERAGMFWSWVFLDDWPRRKEPLSLNGAVNKARFELRKELAYIAMGGAVAEGVLFKKKDLEMHEDEMRGLAKKMLDTSKETTVDSSAFPKNIFDRVLGNVGSSSVPDKRRDPEVKPTRTEEPELDVHCNFRQEFLCVPQERFPADAITSDSKIPEGLPIYDRIMLRYLRLSRKMIDTTLSQETLKERFNEQPDISDGAKNKIFRDVFYDFMVNDFEDEDSRFEKRWKQPFDRKTIEETRGAVDALRFLPFDRMKRYQKSAYNEIGYLDANWRIAFELGKEEGLDTLDGILERAERVRAASGNPYLKKVFWEAHDENRGIYGKISDPKLREAVLTGSDPTLVKRLLLRAYARLQLKSDSSRTRRVKAGLQDRARTDAVPKQYLGFNRLGLELPFRYTDEQRKKLGEFLLEEYMKSIAENPAEMYDAAKSPVDMMAIV